MKKYAPALILGLILLASLFVRFTPIVLERDLWYDEAFTGVLLKAPFGEMNQMIFDDVHPPLYYWLVKPWAAMFGYSPAGIRSFSIVFGLATIISVFWIGKRMFNSANAGLLAAALTAFSPFAIQYSQEARMYSLFGFLFVWSVWFFYRALEKGKKKDYILWGIFAGLSFYTHYLALFFFILFYATYIIYRVLFNKQKFFKTLFGEKRLWLGISVIALFFASWIKIFYVHMMKGNLGWIGVSYPSDLIKTLQIFFFGHPPGTGGVPSPNAFKTVTVGKNIIHEIPLFDEFSVGLIIFVLLAVLASYLWAKKKIQKEVLVLSLMSFGTLLFLVLLSFANIKLYVSRYFMPATVLVYLLTAGVFVTAFKNRFTWIGILVIYFGLLALLAPITYSSGWSKFATNAKNYIDKDTIIVTSNPFDYTTVRYYFGKDQARFYNKGNPSESFNWVLVKDESKFSTLEEIKELSDAVVADWTCDWEGIELSEQVRFADQVSVCAIE